MVKIVKGIHIDVDLVNWDEFLTTFFDRLYACVLREAKVEEFINLK